MNFGIPGKDQTKIKEAFSSLWEVCCNTWDNIVDDTSDEKIKDLEIQIKELEEQVHILTKAKEKLEGKKSHESYELPKTIRFGDHL
tara:strand:+ start:815 stop:1072 length:258 start_codon:yes stop_codon:yes gene_type:complete